jgi:hypothetical protein
LTQDVSKYKIKTNELFAFILPSDQQSSGIGSSYDLGYREPTSTASQQNG